MLRAIAVGRDRIPIKIIMKKTQNPVITGILDALNPEIADTVLDPDDPDILFAMKEYLDQGYIIGMLGDRVTDETKQVECEFLGGQANFSATPILLASIFQVPVILFFGLYRGENRYQTYFELLVDGKDIDRNRREQQIAYWTQRYADRLAHYVRMAPYNWFNFFDFWQEERREKE